METARPILEWAQQQDIDAVQLAAVARMDPKVVAAVVAGQYTPSPQQRERLAAALGVAASDILWGHTVPVDHMYGHGPQFGRSP
jgi:ribosome-binding protein aMBF1 (putative translation factor)